MRMGMVAGNYRIRERRVLSVWRHWGERACGRGLEARKTPETWALDVGYASTTAVYVMIFEPSAPRCRPKKGKSSGWLGCRPRTSHTTPRHLCVCSAHHLPARSGLRAPWCALQFKKDAQLHRTPSAAGLRSALALFPAVSLHETWSGSGTRHAENLSPPKLSQKFYSRIVA